MLLSRSVVTVVALTLMSIHSGVLFVHGDNLADLQAQLKFLAQQLQSCQRNSLSNIFDMKLHFLDANTTCNDGTPAGYYLKKAHGSKRWLVYLEGGWFCVNRKTCEQRANSRMATLMTSSKWRKAKRGTGMLSSNPNENPSWWNANHVLIPYCSSDAWSGNVTSYESGEKFSFLGSRIIEKVIEDLLPKGLYHAKHLVLAGSSAGAIGVLLNVDRVSYKLRSRGYDIDVRGLVDSGWYLDNLTKKPGCTTGSCGPAKTIKQGMSYWRGVVPHACAAKYPSQEWNCYFGNVAFRTLNSSIFIFQWLYDETQLALDGTGRPKSLMSITQKQVTFILQLGKDLRHSLRQGNVHSVFAPACLYHTILTDNNWLKTKIQGHTLDDALNCWMHSSGHNRGLARHKNRIHRGAHCRMHLLDRCQYPMCNPTCPSPRDPFTGKPYTSLNPRPGIPLDLNDDPRTIDRGRL